MKALLLALLICFIGLPAHADNHNQSLQTDWLELVTGHRCEKTGAEIMSVSAHPDSGEHAVMIKMPKVGLDASLVMEEVRVVGQAPQSLEVPELFPELETEWVDDYDNDHYGLLVKFTSDQKTPIRLYFSTGETTLDGAL